MALTIVTSTRVKHAITRFLGLCTNHLRTYDLCTSSNHMFVIFMRYFRDRDFLLPRLRTNRWQRLLNVMMVRHLHVTRVHLPSIALRRSGILKSHLSSELVVKCAIAVEQQVDSHPFVEVWVKLVDFAEAEEHTFRPVRSCLVSSEHVVFDFVGEFIYAICAKKEEHLWIDTKKWIILINSSFNTR